VITAKTNYGGLDILCFKIFKEYTSEMHGEFSAIEGNKLVFGLDTLGSI